MKKELILIRHGNAMEKESGQKDFDRPLDSAGMRAMSRLGKYLKQNNVVPDLVLVSPATRALQSAEFITDQLGLPDDKWRIEEDLYEASVRVILRISLGLKDDLNKVCIVAHNPGLLYFTEFVTGQQLRGLPAGGLIRIVFDDEKWDAIAEKTGRVVGTVFPGEFDV